MNQYLEKAEQMKDELKTWRHYLHQNPEVGLELPVTTSFIMSTLKSFGLKPKEISQSGVVCLIEGVKEGKTFLLRGDSDGLPMPEETDLPFKSTKPDMAHACAHDMHTTMLLGAAKLLHENRKNLNGTVKLMFQPAEETLIGAKSMISAGLLESPKVDAAMGMHIMLDTSIGGLGYGTGYISSSGDNFIIEVKGRGCHGAMPHTGIDPINAAVHIYLAYQSLISRENPTNETTALSICQLTAGNSNNIVPDSAVIKGTLRTYNPEVRSYMKKRIIDIANHTAEMFQATAKFTWLSEVPSIKSDSELVEDIMHYIDGLGYNFTKLPDYRILPSDDFAFVSEQVKTTYLLLCAKMDDNPYPHHNSKVVYDEEVLPIGAAIHAQCATEWLNHHK